jgi:SAM-dependent methyltransferase
MKSMFSKSLSMLDRFIRNRGISIARVKPRPIWPGEISRFDYQRDFNQFSIQPKDVVLDIGSGADPFPLATLLTDRYIEPTHHRSDQLRVDGKPFFLSTVEHLPLADKSVDFVYCAHVLEHVDDPLAACSEIVRVGRRGYVETPTLAKDMLFGWARGMHKWHLMSISDKLLFFEYAERQLEGVRSIAWSDVIFSHNYHPMQGLFYRNQDLFNVMFNWRGGFDCIVLFLDGRWKWETLA